MASDNYYKYVTLLLRGDGLTDNPAVTYDDVTGQYLVNETCVAASTSPKKWGTSCLNFAGDSSGGYALRLRDHPGLYLDGDFTIEFWFYQSSNVTNAPFIGSDLTGGKPNHQVCIKDENSYPFIYQDAYVRATATISPTNDAWHHYAVTRSGTTYRFYLDGNKIGNDVTATAVALDFRVGSIGTLGGYTTPKFSGYLDDLRVTKSIARYTGATYDVPSEGFYYDPLNGDLFYRDVVTLIRGDLLKTDSYYYVDYANGNFCWTQDCIIPSSEQQKWGNSLKCSGGAGANGFVTPRYERVLSADFTIEFWFYQGSRQANKRIIDGGGNNTTNAFLKLDDNSYYPALRTHTDQTVFTATTTIDPSVNTWHHFAVSRRLDKLRFYLDGSKIGNDVTCSASFDFASARFAGAGYSDESYVGYLNDIRITTQARYTESTLTVPTAKFPATDDDVGDHLIPANYNLVPLEGYSSGCLEDYPGGYTSGGSVAWTPSGTVAADKNVRKFGNASIKLSSNGYLYTSYAHNVIRATDFTIEAWINFTSLPTSGNDAGIFGSWAGSSSSSAFSFTVYNSSGTYSLRFYWRTTGSSTTYAEVALSTPFVTGIWYHIAVTRVSGVLKFWVDGTQVGANQSFTLELPDTTATYIYIGNHNGKYLVGNITALRFTAHVARYTATFTPPTYKPKNYYGSRLDPLWSKVSCLLHMEGSNNGTTFTDETGKVWTPEGGAKTSTTQAKVGTTSLYGDGNGDDLIANSHADFDYGVGGFTIEGWFYWTSSGSDYLFDSRYATNDTGITCWTANTNELIVTSNNGSVISTTTDCFPANPGAWKHVVVQKWGNCTASNDRIELWVDGALQKNAYISYTTGVNCPGYFRIGGHCTTASNYFAGYIDEFRVTKGVARYANPFFSSHSNFLSFYANTTLRQYSNAATDTVTRSVELLQGWGLNVVGQSTADSLLTQKWALSTIGSDTTSVDLGIRYYLDAFGNNLTEVGLLQQWGLTSFGLDVSAVELEAKYGLNVTGSDLADIELLQQWRLSTSGSDSTDVVLVNNYYLNAYTLASIPFGQQWDLFTLKGGVGAIALSAEHQLNVFGDDTSDVPLRQEWSFNVPVFADQLFAQQWRLAAVDSTLNAPFSQQWKLYAIENFTDTLFSQQWRLAAVDGVANITLTGEYDLTVFGDNISNVRLIQQWGLNTYVLLDSRLSVIWRQPGAISHPFLAVTPSKPVTVKITQT